MTSPEVNPGADPQNDYTPVDSMQTDATQPVQMTEPTMPMAATSGVDPTRAMPTQTMPQIPSQQFPQSADVVYQAMKDALLKSQGFTLDMADDVIKTANITSRSDGSTYMVQVMENPLGGSVVQIVPQGQTGANMQMESMVFFGELNRELMMQQMTAAAQQNPAALQNADGQQTWAPQSAGTGGGAHAPKKPAGWVMYTAIGALALAVVALILLIVLTPKTGAWLVWVLGLVSLALSGFALYAAFALNKNTVSRILAAVAAVVSVLALVLGFVNVPKAGTSQPSKASSSMSSGGATSDSSDNKVDTKSENKPSETQTPANDETQNQAGTASGLEEITAEIEKDFQSSSAAITAKMTETEAKIGDPIDSYKTNKSALTDWYAFVSSETDALYNKVSDGAVKYMQTLSQKATSDKYLDADALLDDFYKAVYEDAFEDYYDDIYDTAYEDVYDKYYDGLLDDKPENMEYSEWSDLRSEAYKAWSDSKSDFYSTWSDMKSAVYTLYSDVNSEIWDDEFDFTKAIERFQKKTTQFEAQ